LFSEGHAKARLQVLQYKLLHGMWPHPLTFLETVAAGQKAASSSPAVQGPATTGASCPAVQGPVTKAQAATSSDLAPGTAGARAQNCVKRDATARKRPASARKRLRSKTSQ
jgi:hypothetical protein